MLRISSRLRVVEKKRSVRQRRRKSELFERQLKFIQPYHTTTSTYHLLSVFESASRTFADTLSDSLCDIVNHFCAKNNKPSEAAFNGFWCTS